METRQDAELYLADRMKTYAQLVTTNQVLQPVIDSLDLGVAVPDLVKQKRVTIPSDTLVIDMSVSAPTARRPLPLPTVIANQMPWAVADLEGSATVAESPIQSPCYSPPTYPLPIDPQQCR